MTNNGWEALKVDMGVYLQMHVVPIDDLRPHMSSPQCWCRPLDDDPELYLYVHNALDKREEYEEKDWH
jgi:hypothetical protein